MTKLTTTIATAIIGATVGIAGILATPNRADARTCFTVPETGGSLCNTYQHSNRYGDVYTLGYSKGYATEGMKVVCNGAQVVHWESNGTMTQLGAQRLANYFCSI